MTALGTEPGRAVRSVSALLALVAIAGPASAQVSGQMGEAGPNAEAEASTRTPWEEALMLRDTEGDAAVLAYLTALPEETIAADAPLSLLLGTLLREAGDLERAAATFERGLVGAPDPVRPNLWIELAVTRSWAGDLGGAEEAYRRALALDSSSRGARLGLARVLRWRGRLIEAEELYSDLLAGEGDPTEVYTGLGFVALARLEGEEARTWFERALEATAGFPEAMDGLGRLPDADRWRVGWSATRTEGLGARPRVAGTATASYRLGPERTLSAGYQWSPVARELSGVDPNAPETESLAWSAWFGVRERLTPSWDVGFNVRRVTSDAGGGYLATVESGRWLGSRWVLSGGVRAGSLPRIGKELVTWGGLSWVGASGASASLTGFYGTDLREAFSRSLLFTAGARVSDAVGLRLTSAKGWTSSVDFTQTSLGAVVRVTRRHEVNAEAFRFVGAYRSSGVRLGARLGF